MKVQVSTILLKNRPIIDKMVLQKIVVKLDMFFVELEMRCHSAVTYYSFRFHANNG